MTPTPPKRVLVIEDDPQIRENLVWLLEAHGYAVTGAADGRAGLAQVQAARPDLVLCDVMMPEMDGYAVLDAIRRDPATVTLPFLFLTARAEREDQRTGMAAGADDYLTKPFSAREVLAAVEARLERQATFEETQEARLDELRQNISQGLPHELRTPLAAVLGFSKLILEDAPGLTPEVIQEMAQYIHDAGRRLERTVENYSAFAQIELVASDPEARGRLRRSAVADAGRCLPRAVRAVADEHGRAADLHVSVDLPGPAGGRVAVREEHLAKLVQELADNAFKFSEAGTPVHVRVTRRADGVAVEVADRGRGMQPEDARRTGAFLQFDRATHEDQGSGLGLAIARRLADVYDAALDLESRPGAGTTVVLAGLPAAPPAGDGSPHPARRAPSAAGFRKPAADG